ncbi:MAG: ComF family protein [Candidatus Saccharibacteria bacterium]
MAKELVKRLKYHNAREAAKVIANQMTVFPSQIYEHTLVVPVPTATSRVRQRGYDQSVLIARHLSKRYGLKVSELLVRHGQSRQVGSKRDQRVVQLAEAYTVRKPIHVVGSHIILVDDVMTTGATIEAAARALKKAGARTVDACVFARVE